MSWDNSKTSGKLRKGFQSQVGRDESIKVKYCYYQQGEQNVKNYISIALDQFFFRFPFFKNRLRFRKSGVKTDREVGVPL